MRYAKGRWSDDRWERRLGRFFTVAGRTPAATAAAANECIFNFWNPDSVRSLWVWEVSYQISTQVAGALDPHRLCRTSTAGTTPGATVTPDLDNDHQREVTPDTGALLHLADFTTEPTLVLPEISNVSFPTQNNTQAKTWLFPEGLRIPPGSGLALATTGAVASRVADISVRFSE